MSHDGYTLIKNKEILPKLLEVLELLLKKTQSRSKTVQDGYTFSKTSFGRSHTLGRRSVCLLNDCLLNHRFDEATKVLWIMCQDRSCFDLVLYKGIMVVLENYISNNEHEIVKKFSSDIASLRYVNKLEVQLEYLIYGLKNNIHDLEDSTQARTRKRKIKIIPYIDQLYSAYRALLNYITWVNVTQDESLSNDEKDVAFNTIASFKKIIDHPGIWDIFILKLIEMLEYYEKYDEIEEILKKYVDRNPKHLNAYIYICVHLYKHNAESELFFYYAKELFDMCPSDERVLLLVKKWDEMGKYLKKRLKMLFVFLDYPVNGNKMLGWQLLSSHLQQAITSKKSSTMKAVKSSWNLRCHSWNNIHFISTNTQSENFELISCKVKVLSVLDPDHEYITNILAKFPHVSKQQLIHTEVRLPTSENFITVYDLKNSIRGREC